jgi:hypothetical protein
MTFYYFKNFANIFFAFESGFLSRCETEVIIEIGIRIRENFVYVEH